MRHSQKSEKRTHKIDVRFSTSELAELNEKTTLAKKQRAVFIREACLSRNIEMSKTLVLPKEFLFNLNKIGVNLNQIAKACNAKTHGYNDILLALLQIKENTNQLLEELKK